MEEENNIHGFYIVKVPPSPIKVLKEEFEKQYQFWNLERIRILIELDHKKGDEYQINRKLMRVSDLDKRIEWRMSEIKNLERWNQDKVELRFTGKDARTPVIPDRKRCRNKLIKKGRMDMEYLKQVHEEHLCSKKASASQELNELIASMAQRIQHGNMKRADEMKMCREISKLEETKKTLVARGPNSESHQWYTRELKTQRDINWKRSLQHKINIRLEEIENIKTEQIKHIARVTRLKAELEHARKSISCLNKKLESVNSKRLEAYRRAYELREQEKEMQDSSDDGYEPIKKYVKELARKGDVVKLKYECNMQVGGFMRQWNDNKIFREDYEKRKLVYVDTIW